MCPFYGNCGNERLNEIGDRGADQLQDFSLRRTSKRKSARTQQPPQKIGRPRRTQFFEWNSLKIIERVHRTKLRKIVFDTD